MATSNERAFLRLAAELARQKASRSPQLAFSSIEDGSIDEYDANGTLTGRFGQQHDGTHGSVALNGPVPPVPTASAATGGPGEIVIPWDGGFVGGVPKPLDYDFTDALVATDPSMIGAVRAGSFVTGGEITYTTWTGGTFYVALVCESKPGLRSAMSEVVEVVAEPSVTQVNLTAAEDAIAQARVDFEAVDAALTERLGQAELSLSDADLRLDEAETDILTAFGEIDTVDGKATTALSSANSKNKLIRSIAAPSGNGATVGDVWWQYADNTYRIVIGEWSWDGDSWESQQKGHQTLASVDLGTLTVVGQSTLADVVAQEIAARSAQFINLGVEQLDVTGTGTFSTAVMDEAFAEMFATRKLYAEHVVIGNPSNFAPSLLETPEQWGFSGGMGYVTNSSANAEGCRFSWNAEVDTTAWAHGPVRKVTSGEKLYAEATLSRTTTFDGGGFLRYNWYDKDEQPIDPPFTGAPQASTSPNGTKFVIEEAVVPAGAVYTRFTLALTGGTGDGNGGFYNAFGKSKTDGSLIVDGEIFTRHLTATEDIVGNLIRGTSFIGKEFEGGTFTGPLIQTSSDPARGLKLSSFGLTMFDPAGNATFDADSATGNLSIIGELSTGLPGEAGVSVTSDAQGWAGPGQSGIEFRSGAGNEQAHGELFVVSDGEELSDNLSMQMWSPTRGNYNRTSLQLFSQDADTNSLAFLGSTASAYLSIGGSGRTILKSLNGITLMGGSGADGVSIKGGRINLDDALPGYTESFIQSAQRIRFSHPLVYTGQVVEAGWFMADTAIKAPEVQSAGPLTLAGGGTVGLTVDTSSTTGGFLQSQVTYNRTTGSSANMYIASNGVLARSTSARRYKIDPQPVVLPDSLLDVQVKDWLDRAEVEAYAALSDMPRPYTEEQASEMGALEPLRRMIGAIGEEVAESGGDAFVTYGEDGQVEGLSYDRFALARTAVLDRKKADRTELAEIMTRLDVLEGK